MPKVQDKQLERTCPHPHSQVVHLGLGAFFRAHGALYIKEASENTCGVIGVSLRSRSTRDKLAAQNLLYSAVEVSETGIKQQTVEILSDILVAPENPEAVLCAMSAPTTDIVSLTVTEKGYCRSGASRGIDLTNPDIRHDLTHPLPRSAPGYLVRALERRWKAGHRPFTVVSLDNLPANGDLTRESVCALAKQIDPELARWINRECRFPCSMVDRIVPATAPRFVERLRVETGIHDPAAVFHEPFRQWVIEDSFVDGTRPDLEKAGVQLVGDVAPFERMKLRMLNGAHSALAYLGRVAGFETVSEAMNDQSLGDFIDGLWTYELIPSLDPPPGTDLGDYADTLKARFKNPEINHLLRQIAMDGSQKLPQRVLDPLFENRGAGRSQDRLVKVVAAWIMFLEQNSRGGIDDPLAETLIAAIASAQDCSEVARNILSIEEVFGNYASAGIENDVAKALAQFRDNLEERDNREMQP